jgi:hypothetical protein
MLLHSLLLGCHSPSKLFEVGIIRAQGDLAVVAERSLVAFEGDIDGTLAVLKSAGRIPRSVGEPPIDRHGYQANQYATKACNDCRERMIHLFPHSRHVRAHL